MIHCTNNLWGRQKNYKQCFLNLLKINWGWIFTVSNINFPSYSYKYDFLLNFMFSPCFANSERVFSCLMMKNPLLQIFVCSDRSNLSKVLSQTRNTHPNLSPDIREGNDCSIPMYWKDTICAYYSIFFVDGIIKYSVPRDNQILFKLNNLCNFIWFIFTPRIYYWGWFVHNDLYYSEGVQLERKGGPAKRGIRPRNFHGLPGTLKNTAVLLVVWYWIVDISSNWSSVHLHLCGFIVRIGAALPSLFDYVVEIMNSFYFILKKTGGLRKLLFVRCQPQTFLTTQNPSLLNAQDISIIAVITGRTDHQSMFVENKHARRHRVRLICAERCFRACSYCCLCPQF